MSGGFNKFGEYRGARYGNGRHPDLPWGYWLVSKGSVPGDPPLLDEDGQLWTSVRHAFWSGRLGLEWPLSEPTLEFMASYLAILDRRFVDEEERVSDIFQADRHVADFFDAFLTSAGLIANHHERVTPEGRAALAMLISTRDVEDARNAVGMDWILANRSVVSREDRTKAAGRVERAEEVAQRMLYRFTTREIGDLPCVSLIGLHITDEIPVRSTLWSMSWPVADTYARDQFYLWLVERIDRWDDWSEMASREGARALTEHFMKLAFCDRSALDANGTPG
jgi:hypothetical protein